MFERQERQDAKTPSIFEEPCPEVDAVARAVVDAALAVHRVLGPGFFERAYQNAMVVELRARAIDFKAQHRITLTYRDVIVGEGQIDLLVGDRLVVELKSVEELASVHRAQVLAYLKATGLSLGLLLNFNVTMLRQGIKRVVLTPPK